jgi:hypothetical protein
VVAGTGPPASAQLESLRRAVAEASQLPNQGDARAVALTKDQILSWTGYLELEQKLIAHLDYGDPILSLLAFATHQIENREDTALDEARKLFPLFVCNTIAFIEYPDNSQACGKLAIELLEKEFVVSNLLGQKTVPGFRPGRAPKSGPVQELVARYLRNFIWGKRLTSGPTVVVRLLMLAGSLAVLLHYLDCLQHLSPNRELGSADFEWAFDLLETDLAVYRSNLEPIFLQFQSTLG